MKALISFLAERLKRLSPGAILALGLVYVVALALLDYRMPLGMSFTLFYVAGITFVAWAAGRWQGVVVAVVASSAIFAMEWSLLRPGIGSGALLWNYSSRIVIFSAAAWLTAEVSRLTRRLGSLVEERTAQWKAEAELHKDAMDLARLANWEYDPATGLFQFDARFYALYGTTVEREGGSQMSAETYAREFLYPEDAHLVSEVIARALATTDPNFTFQVEHRIRRRDGETRHLVVRVAISKDATGRTVRTRGVNQDITERKLMEEALRQSEERNRAIVATAMDGFALVDQAGRLLDVNAAFCRLSGYTREELLRMSIPDLEVVESPEAVAQHIDGLREAGGRFESRHRRKDGQEIDVEVSVSPAGPLGGLFCCFTRNITERKAVEEALRASEEHYRAVVEDQTEIISRFKSDGTFTFVNEVFCRFFGKTSQELLGTAWQPVAMPEDIPRIEQQLRTLSPSNPVVVVESQICSGLGESHWMQFVNRGYFSAEGRLLEIQSVGRDITERKKAEQRLFEATELNRTLIAASTVGIAAFKASGECVLANEALASIIGGSFLHRNFRELETWRRQGLLKLTDEVLSTRQSRQLEFHTTTFFGKEVFLHLHFTPFVSNGELHLLLLVNDIAEQKRAEEALNLQALVLHNMAEGVLLLAPDMTIQFANPALEATFGYPPGSLLGKPVSFLNAWSPEDSARFNQQVARSAAANGLWTGEYLNRREDGTLFTSEARISLLSLRGQTCFVCVQQDITARKRAEESLKTAQRLQKAILDNIPDPAWLKDAAGRFLACNEPLARIYARRPEDILGKTVFDLVPREAARMAREDKETITSGEPVRREELFTDTQGQTHWFDTVKSPLFNDRGEVTGTVGISRETTQRRQMEEALRESEERYRSLVNNLNIGIYRSTPDLPGRFIQANPALARIHGYDSLDEFQQTPVVDLYQNPADREAFLAHLQRYGTVLNHELHLKQKSGAPIFASITATAHRNQQGEVDWIDGVLEDITERQRLERQILEISDREQARIGQDIHDGLCQQLVSLAFDANSLKQRLSAKNRSNAAIARRIADLLDEAITEARQLARGLFPIRLETEGLPSALEELATATRQRFQLPCRFLSDGPVTIKSNAVATHLYRIAREAVTNAVKHARPRKITIRLRTHPDHLELRVEDDGAGIPVESSSHSGMGLYIMDYRARTIGGTLQLAPGRRGGTTVCCCVPWPRS